jgi:hypothetical protein
MARFNSGVISLALAGACLLVPATGTAEATIVWPDEWETPFIMGNPDYKATLDIRQYNRFFLVRLEDNIPAAGWDNPDCDGPGQAVGVGTLLDATHMRVHLFWLCADGSVELGTRFLACGESGEPDPANDVILFCDELAMTTCGIVFHRSP